MFARMPGRRVPARSSAQIPLDEILARGVGGAPDVGAIAARSDQQVAVLVWHYHDDDVPGPDAAIELEVGGLSRRYTKLEHFRIDAAHSNAYAAWQRMGSPGTVDKAAYEALRAAGRLATLEPAPEAKTAKGRASVRFDLPRQGVSLLVFSFER
jgi:xylan 1,4-beta-xylosidase